MRCVGIIIIQIFSQSSPLQGYFLNLIPNKKLNRIMAPVGIGLALSLIGDTTLYTVLPDPAIAAEAGLSLTVVGIVLGLNRFIRLLTNGLFGLVYDRRPRRKIMLIAMFIAALSTLSYAVSQGPVLILIGRVVWGAAWSAMWIGANTMSLDISENENRGRVTGRLQMWFYFGVAFSALVSGIFTDWLGYRGGLYLSSALTGAGFLIWIFMLTETRPSPKSQLAPEEILEPTNRPYPWLFLAATSVPLFTIGFAFFGILNSTNILWLGKFVDEGLRLGKVMLPLATLSGILLAGRVLISTLGAPVMGALSDYLRNRWLIMTIALALALAGLLMMSQSHPVTALLGAVLISFMTGGISSLSSALVGDKIPEVWHGRSLGLLYTLRDLGATIGPTVALTLTPLIGIEKTYQLTGILIAISTVLSIWMALREPRHKPAQI